MKDWFMKFDKKRTVLSLIELFKPKYCILFPNSLYQKKTNDQL